MSSAAAKALDLAFVRVPRDEWRFDESVSGGRKDRLLNGPSYEQIIAQMVDESILISFRQEHAREREDPVFLRAVATLDVGTSAVDLFHNSASGYRAQYYHDKQLGKRANSFALSKLAPRVITLLADRLERTCPSWWVEKSLLDPHAKVWVHQGPWLFRPMRQLCVERWMKQQDLPDERRAKRAALASLAPDQESWLDIKGGFLTMQGDPLGSLKPARTTDLHELGFTLG